MKQYYSILAVLLLLAVSACDDSEGDKYKGKLIVTVNTDAALWGYPFADGEGTHTLLTTDLDPRDGLWMYPTVGGQGFIFRSDDPGVEDLADETIPGGDFGEKINIVYLYGTLGAAADSYAVLYKGTSSTNGGDITISNIAPGDYYVAAFYDYNYGGNRTNLLNRYDRYSLFDLQSIGTGTPFRDQADRVTINENTVGITLGIDENWVIGKPNPGSGGTGRLFLVQSDGIPQPAYNGTLNVTVNTSTNLWGYPFIDVDGAHTLASTNTDANDGTWMYPTVGGEGATSCSDDPDTADLADETILDADIGDKINYVYLYDSLSGAPITGISSTTNNTPITISYIPPGDYYVVTFYDYKSGGSSTNRLNRYDRYSLYYLDSIGTGTPFADLADTITINEDDTDITLSIYENWILGKPETDEYTGEDREFLVEADGIPVRSVTCP